MTIEERVQVFVRLGNFLTSYLDRMHLDPVRLPDSLTEDAILSKAVLSAWHSNPWFILPNISLALRSVASSLKEAEVVAFARHYKDRIRQQGCPVSVGVIMAGNVPIVGFHDFFCVILSGNRFIGKLSSDDKHLLPALAGIIALWFPELAGMIAFADGKLSGFDAVIATGSDNTSRYFTYYFGKYPHIIRKNRSSVAVLNGNETPDELTDLGIDIFSHFGRGCRNVSKLYLPEGYAPDSLFSYWSQFRFVSDHAKFRNNHDYYRSIYIINDFHFHDNEQVILIENPSLHSPIAVVHYEFFNDPREVNQALLLHRDSLQCVVSADPSIDNRIPFGTAQLPSLFDFADGTDTMDFLVRKWIR